MILHSKKPSVLVAMSGGVDSSVACHLLLEAGYEVRGATIRTWDAGGCETSNSRSCCARDGVEDSRRVAHKLGIPYYVFNFQQEFKHHVMDYFSSEYLKGRTPNPCIACNEHIKFRLFLQRALALGMDYMATGHYAEIERDETAGTFLLKEGADPKKDQSYVLFGLGQDVLSHCLLPVGKYQKEEIRRMAKDLGLANAEKLDSMEICFIPKNNYREFLEKHAGARGQKGAIRNTAGEMLGEHEGFFHFTIGQRRWLGLSAKVPLYVKELRPETNEVIVGTKEEVFQTRFRVEQINWLIDVHAKSSSLRGCVAAEAIHGHVDCFVPSGLAKTQQPLWKVEHAQREIFHFDVKIRSNHRKAPAVVERIDESNAEVSFAEPQDAITPGQAAVFYDGPVVVGGGWIR